MSKDDNQAWANLIVAFIIAAIFYSFGHAKGELSMYKDTGEDKVIECKLTADAFVQDKIGTP